MLFTSVSEWKFIIASAFKLKLLRQPEAADCVLTIMVRATASWAETSGSLVDMFIIKYRFSIGVSRLVLKPRK